MGFPFQNLDKKRPCFRLLRKLTAQKGVNEREFKTYTEPEVYLFRIWDMSFGIQRIIQFKSCLERIRARLLVSIVKQEQQLSVSANTPEIGGFANIKVVEILLVTDLSQCQNSLKGGPGFFLSKITFLFCRNCTVARVFWMSGIFSFNPTARFVVLASINWYFLLNEVEYHLMPPLADDTCQSQRMPHSEHH